MNRDYKAEPGGQRPAVAEDIPTSTDWRALCAELAYELDHYYNGIHPLADKARATLAQSEPVGPTDEEIAECLVAAGVDAMEGESDGTNRMYWEGWNEQIIAGCRAVIAVDRARLGTPPIRPVPVAEPDEVTPAEIYRLIEEVDKKGLARPGLVRAALARWGRPAIKPVPVAERLPEAGDCAPWLDEPDANHWCWLGKEISGGWEWSQASALDIAAVQLQRVLAGGGWTHWLPAHALPIPTSQEVLE